MIIKNRPPTVQLRRRAGLDAAVANISSHAMDVDVHQGDFVVDRDTTFEHTEFLVGNDSANQLVSERCAKKHEDLANI